jgi:hypothetical protein
MPYDGEGTRRGGVRGVPPGAEALAADGVRGLVVGAELSGRKSESVFAFVFGEQDQESCGSGVSCTGGVAGWRLACRGGDGVLIELQEERNKSFFNR